MTVDGLKTVFFWALDYGFPFYTTQTNKMFPLQESSFRLPFSKIFVAGLEVLPAIIRFNYFKSKPETVFTKEWTRRAVDLFKSSVEAAEEVFFVPSKTVSHCEVRIGDLIIGKDERIEYAMGSMMEKNDTAIHVKKEKFTDHFDKLNTNIIERWNDNLRSKRKFDLKYYLNLNISSFFSWRSFEES